MGTPRILNILSNNFYKQSFQISIMFCIPIFKRLNLLVSTELLGFFFEGVRVADPGRMSGSGQTQVKKERIFLLQG